VLLLPLTGFIGYFEGGAFAWLAVVAVAIAVTVSTVLMVAMSGMLRMGLSSPRLLTLSLAMTGCTAATQIRFDAFNYLIVATVAALAFPSAPGFGSNTVATVVNDIWTTFADVGSQIVVISNYGWFLASVIIAFYALKGVWKLARHMQSVHRQRWLSYFIILSGALATAILIDGYNEWRGVDIVFGQLSYIANMWVALTKALPFLRFTLAPLLAFIVWAVLKMSHVGFNSPGE
jgi:hypothetical protein